MSIEPTPENVIHQFELTSAALANLSYMLGAFSGTFTYETEPPYSYDIYQIVESCTGLHGRIANLIAKIRAKQDEDQ